MKNNLVLYFVYEVLNLMFLGLSLKYLIVSVNAIDYVGVLLWSIILSVDLNDVINRYRNFTKYYPNFQDKWLNFL
jgi:hypothetical protein